MAFVQTQLCLITLQKYFWMPKFSHNNPSLKQRIIISTMLLNSLNVSTSIVHQRSGAARLDRLQPSLKNVKQKIPPNGQSRLKFGFSYENFTTQSLSVFPTPFRLNVS